MTIINRNISLQTISTVVAGFVSLLSPCRLHAAAPSLPEKAGSGIESTIFFSAKDSVIYNFDRRTIELRGKAAINHESRRLTAPGIVIDLNTEQLRASGVADSSKQLTDPAVFSDSKGSFNAETITYDFRRQRGETSNVTSSSSELIFQGEHVSRLDSGELQISDGTYTTCDDDDPHYWISSSSLTIIPGKKVVARPLVLYVRPEVFSRRLPAVPILALPYMVFPLQEARSSGFLTPTPSRASDRGYFVSNLGYFWAIDEYMDLKVDGDLALNGSWRLGNRFRYTKQHDFSGGIAGEFKRNILNSDGSVHRDWNLSVLHNQLVDPSTRLDLNLDFQGGERIYELHSVNAETILTGQANARGSLGKTFNDESTIGALYFDRIKDLSTHKATDTFGASFYRNRFYPFNSALSVSSAAALSGSATSQDGPSSSGYSASADVEMGYYREFSEGYKALFTQGISLLAREPVPGLDEDVYSAKRVLFPLRMQSTLFRYFNVNPSLTFTRFLSSASSDRDFSTTVFSVDASTRLYGSVQTGLPGLKALRHTFIPTLTYTWNPAFSGIGSDYYQRHLYDWTYGTRYNRFENRWYSGLPEGQSRVGISLNNLFHGKFIGSSGQAESDSFYDGHTVQLLALNVATSYNFAAESLKLEPLILTAQSNALSPDFLLSAGGMYDFYSYDPLSGVRVNRFNKDEGKGLLRFVRGFLNMGFTLQGRRVAGASAPAAGPAIQMNPSSLLRDRILNNGEYSDIDYTLPWQFRLSLYLQSDRSNPLEPTTTSLVTASSTFSVSKTWQVSVNTGYDLRNREVIFPMLQLYRDLHCWQVGFQWVPSGSFRSYAIQIGLKTPQLRDLRLKHSGSTSL